MKINYKRLIISLAIPQLAGLLGSIANFTSLDSWYTQLNRPSFNPPNWIFGPVWTLLFILMGLALYFVWEKKTFCTKKQIKLAMWLFAVQLILNILWSFLFFYFQNPTAAFVEIVILLAIIIWNMFVFYRIDKKAGLFLLPYALWVSFATVLNWMFVILN